MTIFRTTDETKWGAGKGGNLTPTEVDENFWGHEKRITDIENNPIQPKEIDSISVIGNQMTIILSDYSVFGPFTLPTAAFTYREEGWLPDTNYLSGDLFAHEDRLWLVNQAHTSGDEFDPFAEGPAGLLYADLMPFPTKYSIGFFFPGTPGAGVVVGQPMFGHLFKEDVLFPAGLTGSGARLLTGPTVALSCDIQKNGVSIGTLGFNIGSTDPVFIFATDIAFADGDLLTIVRPAALDASAASLFVTLVARKLPNTLS